ncbi:MAG: arylesterase [Alphaproteobacteria bacterium]|nr:arylesterase [Alphaproteobacteria bacterium]
MTFRYRNTRARASGSSSFFSLLAILAIFLSGINDLRAAEAPALRILALGTSLTQGYNLPPGTDYCAVLEAKLKARGHKVRIINGGVSGDTTAGGLSRLEWLLEEKVDGVIVELGSNDALRSFDTKETERNLDRILEILGERGLPVLFAGMKSPRNLGADYVKAYDAIFPALAKKHGVLFFPFFLEGVAADPKLNQKDGIHPNEKGTQVIVRNILPHVEALIAQIKSRKKR